MARIPPGSPPRLTVDDFRGNERVVMGIDVTNEFVSWWDDHLHGPFGLTPESLADILLHGLTRDETLTYYKYVGERPKARLNIAVEGWFGRRLIYLAGETLHLDMDTERITSERHIEVDLIDVAPDHQGRGISAELMANTYELAKVLRVSKFAVEAYLSGGPYAWPRYGFIPLAKHWKDIREKMRSKLVDLDEQVPADVRARIEPILRSENPRAIFALMDEDTPVDSAGPDGTVRSVGLARALLADTDQRWYGVLDLEDPPSEALFKAVIARNARW